MMDLPFFWSKKWQTFGTDKSRDHLRDESCEARQYVATSFVLSRPVRTTKLVGEIRYPPNVAPENWCWDPGPFAFRCCVRFSEVYFPQWFCKRKVLWKDSSRKPIYERLQRRQRKAVVEQTCRSFSFPSIFLFVFCETWPFFFSELGKSQKRFWFWWPILRVLFLRQKMMDSSSAGPFFFPGFFKILPDLGLGMPNGESWRAVWWQDFFFFSKKSLL